MNYKIIAQTAGKVMLIEAACFVPMIIAALLFGDSVLPFLVSVLVTVALGLPLAKIKSSNKSHFFARNAFVTVVVAWLTLSVFGALPFLISGRFESIIDCFFESISGFTTTGATIYYDVESLPRSILLWRSFTNFIGGMGILVLATALVSNHQDRSFHLMQAEVPGPTASKLVPKLSQSSKILYCIYIALTIIELITLLIAGLDLFDAVNLSLTTAGTGGFSVTNANILAYHSATIETILSIFMFIYSINFAIYFLLLTGRLKQIAKNRELRFFLAFVAVSVLLITWNIHGTYGNIPDSLRHAFFTVTSAVSTTGFTFADYDFWPELSKLIILILMVVGACAGSTSGGIKCSRIMIAFESIKHEVKKLIHPRSINVVTLGDDVVRQRTVNSVTRFLVAYFLVLILSTFLITFDGFDIQSNMTTVISCLSNVGHGFNLTGPLRDYSFYSGFSKIVLSMCMLIGRLEIFPVLVFLSPATWKKS